ncbi:hypothetical protein B0J14DRAFT_668756, partial [Halenospora varia]
AACLPTPRFGTSAQQVPNAPESEISIIVPDTFSVELPAMTVTQWVLPPKRTTFFRVVGQQFVNNFLPSELDISVFGKTFTGFTTPTVTPTATPATQSNSTTNPLEPTDKPSNHSFCTFIGRRRAKQAARDIELADWLAETIAAREEARLVPMDAASVRSGDEGVFPVREEEEDIANGVGVAEQEDRVLGIVPPRRHGGEDVERVVAHVIN